MMLYLVLALVFIEIIFVVLIIYSYIQQKKPIARLNQYFEWEREQKQSQGIKLPKTDFKSILHALGKAVMKLFALNRYRERMDKSLIRADIPLRAEEMMFIIFFAVLFTFSMGVLLTKRLVASILMAAIVLMIFKAVIKNKEQKRLKEINEQLGDALDMMAGSLRTGYSFAQALETTSREMPLPISKELSRAVKEMELGLSVEKALGNLLERVPSDDLELLITAVLIQRQIGGNLAEILDNISGTIRQRIKLKRDVKTLTAQGKISGLIVGLLPIVFVILIFLINPDYIKVLFTSRFGLTMVGIGAVGQLIGIILVKKIINIQY